MIIITTEIYLILIIIVIVLIGIMLIKFFLKHLNILYTFTKKDILLFSTFSIYLLFSFIINSVFVVSSIKNKDIYSRPSYENNKLYNEVNRMNPNQDNYIGNFEIASQKSLAINKSFAVIMGVFFIVMITVIFIPLFIILLMELFLLILAIFQSKNIFLIRSFLHFNYLLKKIFFNTYYKNYPLRQRTFIINNVGHNNNINVSNREYEKAKEEIELYEKSISLVTKNNTSLMYREAASMLFLIIISFFIINLIFISYDLYDILLIKKILSPSVLASSVLFIFILGKMFSFLIKYKREHATEFFQQKSRGDKLFLFCIILILIINIVFLSISSLELFGALYAMSYLFDLVYKTYDSRRTSQPNS